ncbi:carbohydrate kinase, thermoresistant glucokinase family [Pseudarthrobacter chlorophenolicus A6]|uniref:gluconokinase n=1 Tax=Pseudarthrobacter chlorophenolicus (strain ATCC 700700 / DSM 12829 / CIP 107037 / JCM 12360 / KCTC 9906 / NCIMB 13794 / A6) TaxID=452863 RepID=B8HAL1_PSECP|nr:gluconokinase [Pseudarthrobacter chlorophenolicus]ACL38472.1 carbohydrate kinase, thermoresistant glucokinase family [Pseudarthrobacter chlorophenolicus A6]SDQ48012.1 gluconate kinase, SKI family [Pseudarthrobacter chlorophenolicus]
MTTQVPPLVVMGVSGCGKSTVGALLAGRLGVPFLDGDDFHPAANKEKMAAGIPLTDSDREPWLARIGHLLAGQDPVGPGPAGKNPVGSGAGAAGNYDGGTPVAPIVACSALKRSYRDLLRAAAPDVVFVHLSGSPETIAARMDARAHEFMPRTLLESQLATLEALESDEAHILGDIALDPGALVDAIVHKLRSRAGETAA